MELHVTRLRPVASKLAEFGCMLGLEYVGPRTLRAGHKYEFISTLSETLELIDRLGLDNVGVLLDCWQWYTANETLAELDELDGAKVVYVHLNDAPVGRDVSTQIDDQRMLPGATGVIDVENFLKALQRLAFEGPVAVEPFNAELNSLEPRERAKLARRSVDVVFDKAGLSIE
jgi:sugar phosphate isomerase/epimerase